MFDTKIAVVLRDDLAVWQKLNATAFLTSGLVGAAPELIGESYEDGAGNARHALIVQPMIVLEATGDRLARSAGDRRAPHHDRPDSRREADVASASGAPRRRYSRGLMPCSSAKARVNALCSE